MTEEKDLLINELQNELYMQFIREMTNYKNIVLLKNQ